MKRCQVLLASDGLGCVEMVARWFVCELDRLLTVWLAYDPLQGGMDRD